MRSRTVQCHRGRCGDRSQETARAPLAGPEISLAEIAVEFIKSVSAAGRTPRCILTFTQVTPPIARIRPSHATMNTQDVRWALGLTVIKDLLGGHKAEDVVCDHTVSPAGVDRPRPS